MEKSLVNINGKISPPEEAKISVFDRGLLYGDSVYEVTRSYNNQLFLLEEHLDRLWYSASRLSFPMKVTRREITQEIHRTFKEFNTANSYLRIILTRGEGQISLDPEKSARENYILIFKEQIENPSWWYEKGVTIGIAQTRRNDTTALDPNIKSGNYLNNVLAALEAKKLGHFDVVMLNKDGLVTECTLSNIWIVQDGKVLTPPVRTGLLAGITRKHILELCEKNNIIIEEKNFQDVDLMNAQESFLTSSTREIVPIVQVGNQKIGEGIPGTMTKKLISLYKDFISSCQK